MTLLVTMALIEIRRNPSPRELRWFGLSFLGFWLLAGGLLYAGSGSLPAAVLLWGVAAAVTVLYYALPRLRRPLYVSWLMAAYPAGWLVSHAVLAAAFYLVLVPTGLVLKLLGRDPLERRRDREASSYWVRRRGPPEPERYFRQF